MFSLICVWNNSWVNSGDADDLRRNRVHYDVIVMWPDGKFGYHQFMELLVACQVVGPMLTHRHRDNISVTFQRNIIQPLIQQNTFGNAVCQNVDHVIQASICQLPLTHWDRVTQICDSKLPKVRQRLVVWSALSHYLTQCWGIANWTLRNKLQPNLNSSIFVEENIFKYLQNGSHCVSPSMC